ncbi:MAG: amino acid permease [Candidatus Competibacter denitrificans]
MSNDSSSLPTAQLKRQLSWIDAAAIFVGIILGSGIFVAPAEIAGAISSPFLAASLWLVGAAIAACGAFCYAECGARLPRPGGFFVFYGAAYGPAVAFVAGWAALFITYPAALAAISLIFARYLNEVIPGIAATDFRAALMGTIALIAVAGLNIIGVRLGAGVQKALTAFKVLALLALCVAAIAAPTVSTPVASAPPPELFPNGFAGVISAMVVLLWTFDGWSDVSMIAGELKNPAKDFGRAVLVGVAMLATTYMVVQYATMSLLGSAGAAASKQVVAQAVGVGLGPGFAKVVALLVVVSTLGALNGIVLAVSRLAFAMARDRAFLPWFGEVHPRFETPARSTLMLIGVALLYVFAADFRDLMGFFVFNVWLFYGATAIALLKLRCLKVGEPLQWHAPLGMLPPVVVLLTGGLMTLGLLAQSPLRSMIGLGMLLVAFPLYWLWTALQK